MRTRIKICGLKEAEHVDAAVDAGADAIGFVFYRPSIRYVTPERAAVLAARVPAFVAIVGLFVDASSDEVASVLAGVRVDVLQFHGSEAHETAEWCRRFGRPYVKARAVHQPIDVLEFQQTYPDAAALLLDTPSNTHGGSGRSFDWSLIHRRSDPVPSPADASERAYAAPAARLVLSGGLTAANVASAIERVQPFAVDVSSGVEEARGTKSSELIRAFCHAVRLADQRYRACWR